MYAVINKNAISSQLEINELALSINKVNLGILVIEAQFFLLSISYWCAVKVFTPKNPVQQLQISAFTDIFNIVYVQYLA